MVLSFLWILTCTAIYYGLARCSLKVLLARPGAIVPSLIVVSLCARLVPAVLLPGGAIYDIESFERVAQTLLRGEGVYSSALVQGRHPYLPLQMYLIALAMLIAKATGWSFAFVVKWSPIMADGALSVLIFRAYDNRNERER